MYEEEVFDVEKVYELSFTVFQLGSHYCTPRGRLRNTLLLRYRWVFPKEEGKGKGTLILSLMTNAWKLIEVHIPILMDEDQDLIQHWLKEELGRTRAFFHENPLGVFPRG